MPNQPQTSPLQISHFAFKLNVQGDPKQFYTHAREVAQCHPNTLIELPYVHGDRYRSLYQINSNERMYCQLKLDPLIESNAPLRIELHPAPDRMDHAGVAKRMMLELLGTEYEQCMNLGTAISLKVSVEISGVNLEELYFFDETKKKSAVLLDANGQICGLHLGVEQSNKSHLINPVASPSAVSVLSEFNNKPTQPKVRLESTIKSLNCRISELPTIQNPFAPLHIIKLASGTDSWRSMRWRGFLDSCRYRGMHAALARVEDASVRAKFRKHLCSNLSVHWWNPTHIWSGLPAAISALQLFEELRESPDA